MSTEQSPVDSGDSIESRLAGALSREEPASEAAPVEPAAVSSPEPTEQSDNTEGEAVEETADEGTDEGFDFEADDGTVVKAPAALKGAVLRQKDYTQSKQALANLQAQATDRLQYAEAREQLAAAVIQDVADLRSMQSELQKFQSADWSALYDANPGQALKFQQQMRDLEKQCQDKQAAIQGKAAHIQQATAKHVQFQWERAEQGARELIGTITPAENVAMAQTIKGLGISEQEFKSRFADPRIIAAVHKAAKWDALQSGKSKAVASATNAPPVVKPGASKGPGAASQQRYADVRSKLRKSGSLDDAARLFLLRGNK